MSTKTAMSFKVKTKTADEWKAIISAISTLVDEATFEADDEGMRFRGMDPSHIGLIDVYWPRTGFEEYECTSDIKFGIRIDEFSKMIKRGEKKDSCELQVLDDNMLHLKLQNGYTRSYKLRLIESSASSTPLPKLNFNAKTAMSSAAFDKVMSDVQVVSQYVIIGAKDDGISFSGKGDMGEATVFLEKGNEGLLELVVKENSTATYSLDYISKISKALISSADSVILEHSDKMPLRLEFKLGDVGKIRFYLAPRVQE